MERRYGQGSQSGTQTNYGETQYGQSGEGSIGRPQQEGPVAKAIEKETSRLPSDTFLWTGMGMMGTSLLLRLAGKKNAANFFGEWVPTILLFGVYNKIVKVAGHDAYEHRVDR
jgi:hypothetical protein